MMGIIAYRQAVAVLIGAWIDSGKLLATLEPVAEMLGCRYLVFKFGYELREPVQPAVHCETAVREALLALLLQHERDSIIARKVEHTLLDGLLRNDRWRHCLGKLPTAYAFVALLADFIDNGGGHFASRHVRVFHRLVAVQLEPILNDWLGPPAGQAGYTQRLFARALFGEAWCTLVWDRLPPDTSMTSFILETKPRFRAGLVEGQSEVEEEDLPELMGA